MSKYSNQAHHFLLGVGSALTLRASKGPSYLSRSDEEAIRSDWKAVGLDIYSGIYKFRSDLALVQPELDWGDHATSSKPTVAE